MLESMKATQEISSCAKGTAKTCKNFLQTVPCLFVLSKRKKAFSLLLLKIRGSDFPQGHLGPKENMRKLKSCRTLMGICSSKSLFVI